MWIDITTGRKNHGKTRYSWNLSSKPHASLNLLLDPRFAIIIQVPRDTTMGSRGFGCGKRMKRCGWLNTIEPSQEWMMAIIHTTRSEFFLFPPNFWHLGIAMELWWNLACDSLPFHSWIQCSFSRFLHSSRLNKPIAIRPCNQVLSPSEQYRYVDYTCEMFIMNLDVTSSYPHVISDVFPLEILWRVWQWFHGVGRRWWILSVFPGKQESCEWRLGTVVNFDILILIASSGGQVGVLSTILIYIIYIYARKNPLLHTMHYKGHAPQCMICVTAGIIYISLFALVVGSWPTTYQEVKNLRKQPWHLQRALECIPQMLSTRLGPEYIRKNDSWMFWCFLVW